MNDARKERITISIDRELLVWLDQKVQERIFANRSHGFEFLLSRSMGGKGANEDEKTQ
jgi:metal-responsive CopG/Arc/MetJ family transcriptional regulator